MLSRFVFLFVFLATCLAGDEYIYFYSKPHLAVFTCDNAISKVATLYKKKTDPDAYCDVNMQHALGSMAVCLDKLGYKGTDEFYVKYCAKLHMKLTVEDIQAARLNATDKLVNTSSVEGFNKTKVFYSPVMVPKKRLATTYKSAYARYHNFNYTSAFSITFLGYWFVVMGIAAICNFTYFLAPNVVKKSTGKWINLYRRYVSLPAVYKKKHAVAGGFKSIPLALIPTRLDTFLVALWLVLAVVFSCVGFNHVEGNVYWVRQQAELGRYISDRSAGFAVWLLPLTILFAGRNNFLQWLTGWHYSRFSMLHRWIARTVFTWSLVHLISMSLSGLGISRAKYLDRNARADVRWGYAAFFAGFFMMIQSMLYFRKKAYELFLLIHIALAVVFIAGTFIHVREYGLKKMSIAAVVVWGFDRFVRLVRLAVFGIRTARVTLVADEILRIRIPVPSWWKPYPSAHVFVHFLRPTCFWQSHPFTVIKSYQESNEIVVVAKVKGGMTHGLYQYLSNKPERTADIRVAVEGPYGVNLPLSRFDETVFIASGTGVAGLFYEAVELAKKTKTAVNFIWIVRSYASVEWFYDELVCLGEHNVKPTVYVSKSELNLLKDITKNSDSEDEKSMEKELYVDKLKSTLDFINFVEEKPVIEQIVGDSIQQASGATAFITCAHPDIVDEARYTVATSLDNSRYRIDLFEMLQEW